MTPDIITDRFPAVADRLGSDIEVYACKRHGGRALFTVWPAAISYEPQRKPEP